MTVVVAGRGMGPDGLAPVAVLPGRTRPSTANRAATWLREHSVSIIVVVAVLVPVVLVQAHGMATYPARFDDEGTYVSQAWSLLTHGQLAPYTYWYDHPPLGWMQLAGYFWVTDALPRASSAVAAGREAMLVAHVVSSILLFILVRRLGFARTWALVAVVLFSFSPLALTYHRMVLLDNIATPWLLAAFVLALTPQHRLAAYAASALCFVAAVMTKETMLLFLPPLVYQVWRNTDASNRAYAWAIFASMLVLTALLFPLYALLKGELLPGPGHVSLVGGIEFQLTRPPVQSSQTVAGWLRMDPYLLGLGTIALVPAAAIRSLRPYALMAVILIVMLARGGYVPIPFVIGLLIPAAILVPGVLDRVFKVRPARLRVLGPLAALAAAATIGAVVYPSWNGGVQTAMHYDEDAPLRQAEAWIEANATTSDRLLVDNAIWVDLVRSGLPERNVVWFYKLDLDPATAGGIHGFDYIVSTQTLRDIAEHTLPQVWTGLQNSVVVASFGHGTSIVEIRKIVFGTAGTPSDEGM